MAMLRTAKCDLCETTQTEKVYGNGWEGWAIIQGIAAVEPDKDKPLTTENTSIMLCPKHKNDVANFIGTLQEEV